MFRVGFGYDVHKLAEGESLILGGVQIEHTKGTVAHSDGDVLVHAIIDALLGAIAQKDIGFWFPDTDNKYKNVDSLQLLKKTKEIIEQNNYTISNIDSTLALQKPKIKPFIDAMCEKIAQTLCLETNQVSVKATTTENLGFEGREEGVSAYAVVMVFKN